ncbi:unnamed protein product [Caenorhabditis angaria]|uniref:G-protein coupled receptors family 1 profile domain-containing protein n=1 Tax=Caenorhabditis angaria TaxID=860376 RepID=A0A9P1J3Q6_9PELO|nr:unnamed protein product [Caenorhabditis angaria]
MNTTFAILNETVANGTEANCTETFVSSASMENCLKLFERCMTIACFFSTFLQVYVIRKAIKYIKRGSGDECLHVFLLSMTLGDILLTSFCYPIEQMREQQLINPPTWVNICQHFLTWLGLLVSSASLILLNADKLLFFKFPLRYTNIVTSTKAMMIVVFVWVGCFLFVCLCWWLECFECNQSCRTLLIFKDKVSMYIVFTTSACILPSLTSLFVAIYIMNVVTSHRTKLSDENSNSSHALASRLRTFYFIFMATIFTAVTLLPYRLYNIKRQLFTDEDDSYSCLDLYYPWILLYLVSLNAILNPLITVTVLPQYRFRWLCKVMGCATNPSPVHV